jgi:hypothetical protein
VEEAAQAGGAAFSAPADAAGPILSQPEASDEFVTGVSAGVMLRDRHGRFVDGTCRYDARISPPWRQ